MFAHRSRRQRAAPWLLIAVTLLALGLAAPAFAQGDDGQTDEVGVLADRADGLDRFVTAGNLATTSFESSDTAIVTTGETFPDALSASYGAGVADAPIQLTGSDALPEPTVMTLRGLDVEHVVLVGGTAAVAPEVEQELAAEGYDVTRVAGSDRYRTATHLAGDWADADDVGSLEGDRAALLASGEGFADALSAGPIAAGAQLPLLLTTSQATELTSAAADTMDDLDIDRVVVVGGEAAVDGDVVAYLSDRGFEVERWAGDTRTATAQVVANNATERLGFAADPALLARGDDFADALASSAHAGAQQAPVLLTADSDTLDASGRQWLADHCDDIGTVRVIGGPGAVGSAVLGAAAETVEACHERVGEFDDDPRSSREFPSGARSPQLADLRGATGGDHDRVEWEFDGDRPAWQVTWDDEPTHPQTGEALDVAGDAYLHVTLTGHAHWAGGDYTGPERVELAGDAIAEAKLVQDFEGMTQWVVGLENRAAFAPRISVGPTRFALDVAHP